MIDAVIFDMDGVLIDSTSAAHHAKRELLARHGVDVDTVPDPHNEQHRGSSVRTLLQAVEKHHGVKIDEEEFGREATDLIFKRLRENGTSADPDLITFLEELRAHAVPCAIASSGLKQSVENKLSILGIKKYFKVVITASDVTRHKPDPSAYTFTMQRLNVRPEHCIIFEDSAAGVQAGRAAGGIVVGYGGYLEHSEPIPDTHLTIQSWADISYEKLRKFTAHE
jgi:beta-phosphoglucomutase